MGHVMQSAPPPLDRFIETFWYWEGDPLDHLKDTILASARPGLLINLAEDRLSWYDGAGFTASHGMRGIGIAGPNARAVAIDAFHRKMMGVQFRAGGAFPFFGPPMRALADRHVALADLWGAQAERLHQRLIEAPTPADKFDILLRALLKRAPEVFEYHPAVLHALRIFARAPHRTTVAAVAEQTDLSRKRFIQVFSEQVGFRPKLYLRVARFQRALSQIARAPDVDWGDVAERNGYYDQSHFVNDFGEFSGLSPTVYFKRCGPHLQHVPMPA
jgi:AraC-like DNA-binding protein